jgi:hypothetical protein
VRLGRMALVIALLGLLVLLTACDKFIVYTVINETDEELITWPLLDHCDVLVGHKGDYMHEEVVEPRQTHDYVLITGPVSDPECVQVATKDRRLVLSEPYEYDGTYTVTEPLQPFSDPIPKKGDLPREPLSESFQETPWLVILWGAFTLTILVGVPVVGFIAIRFLYPRCRNQAVIIRVIALTAVLLPGTLMWLWALRGLLLALGVEWTLLLPQLLP